MKSKSFKQFILHEGTNYLSVKIGDVLSAIQELKNDSNHLGSRDLTRYSERIVNQIRRILHSNWGRENHKHLLILQKVGVALSKSLDEKDDIMGTIASSVSMLEKLVGDMGMPINKLASSDKDEEETDNKGTDKRQDVPPPKAKNIDKQKQVGSPPQTGTELITPPLGGTQPDILSAV